jgi:hypothetical protein
MSQCFATKEGIEFQLGLDEAKALLPEPVIHEIDWSTMGEYVCPICDDPLTKEESTATAMIRGDEDDDEYINVACHATCMARQMYRVATDRHMEDDR